MASEVREFQNEVRNTEGGMNFLFHASLRCPSKSLTEEYQKRTQTVRSIESRLVGVSSVSHTEFGAATAVIPQTEAGYLEFHRSDITIGRKSWNQRAECFV